MLKFDVSSYSRRNSNVSEYNYDAMLNFNKDLTEKLNLEGNIGFNLRNKCKTVSAQTNGGLNLRSLLSSNSVTPINAPLEYDSSSMVDGEYIRASLGYDGFAFLEGSFRSDRSSTYQKLTTDLIISQYLEV
jgi:hypothetical protein